MTTYRKRTTRCALCNKQAPCYLFDGTRNGFRIPMCQPCARSWHGDTYIDNLIRHGVLRWRLPQRESQQATLIPEG